MPEYPSLTAAEVIARLREPAPTLILYHVRSDADAIGSAFATALWLKAMGSPAYCVCADEIPSRLCFLTDSLQESALRESIPAEFENARVITVDTASRAQLGALAEVYEGRISLMIDHHGRGEVYAPCYRVADAAATGELIASLIGASGVALDARMAKLLYAAVSGDTGCFKFSNTTGATHLCAAALVNTGIDTAEINRRLFDSKSMSLLRAEKAGFERLRLYCGGRVAILTFPYSLKSALDLREEDLETLIDVARSVEGVDVAAAIRQPSEEGVFRLSMRAAVDMDVSAICAKFGGGGHARAAGATLHGETVDKAAEAVLSEIEKSL